MLKLLPLLLQEQRFVKSFDDVETGVPCIIRAYHGTGYKTQIDSAGGFEVPNNSNNPFVEKVFQKANRSERDKQDLLGAGVYFTDMKFYYFSGTI